ncbi:MAG TPA: nucleotidyltransferase domain-containing protein [Lacibacter sp.]|nr:nucleotidyltransferase domain-containing protein [Lacibacter sp.]HMO89275.1 nucleotidyltransferase domain-containing protein [Lacibacter sp.]HMP86044.1 nucleotidyltransferase domain-containing protein [Lacibacter sp.]
MKRGIPIQPDTGHNRQLANLFHQMAQCYRYLGPDERFRALAYENASRILANMQEPVDLYGNDLKKLDTIKGVGESIAEKIVEFLQTGTIRTLEELKRRVPYGLLELMELEGFGPATVRLLHNSRGINSKEDLVAALGDGRLTGIKGIGPKKIAHMKQALKLENAKKRIPLQQATVLGKKLIDVLEKIPHLLHPTLAGSLRRRKETVGDLDIVAVAAPRYRRQIMQQLRGLSCVERMLSTGTTRASFLLQPGSVQVDLRLVSEAEFGAALLYFTGSKEHNIRLRTLARQRGWKINDYGLFDLRSGRQLAGKSEEEMYHQLGFRYIPPEERLGKNELKAAALPPVA